MRRLLILFASVVLTGATFFSTAVAHSPVDRASATLVDSTGATVGFVTFVQQASGQVVVSIHASGLTPGQHGIHIHAVGSCVTPDFLSAAGHFNPTGATHGAHAGDLGNITANPAGRANLVILTSAFTISDGPLALLDSDGGALVVHAGADDLISDPSGNSGGRVVCGVIHAD